MSLQKRLQLDTGISPSPSVAKQQTPRPLAKLLHEPAFNAVAQLERICIAWRVCQANTHHQLFNPRE